MMNYLIDHHIMPKMFPEAGRLQWLAIWLLYPYLRYIRALWPHRVFAFQRRPGEDEPPCSNLPNYGVVHPAGPGTEEQAEENQEEQFDLMDFELEEEFPPW
jgi:hypothetical protein